MSWKQQISTSAVTLLFKGFSLLPLSLLQTLGSGLGSLLWALQGREAKITLRNLTLCFPEIEENERRLLAKHSLKETGKLGLEMAKVWMQPPQQSVMLIRNREQQLENLRRVARDGAVLIVAPHLGNWEIMNLFIGTHFQINVLYQPPKQQVLEGIIARAREQTGSRVFPTTRKGIAALFQALRNDEWVGILPDQEPEREAGCFVPFLGQDALTMTLISKLVQKTRPTVVFAYAKRLAPGEGFELRTHLAEDSIYSEDLEESVTALSAGVERCVRESVEQYQWEYKRFRRSRDGNTKNYDSL